jgi:hypothetical protein
MVTTITINPRLPHIILILNTTHLQITHTILHPQDTPQPHKGTHNHLLHLMIQPLRDRDRGIGPMYLLLLIHDDHLLLKVKGSIDPQLKDRGRAVK